ncbi:uncharacterized protein I303_108601 [Kwoniella dejecticola CBS 10117]|uniref:Uncharacterized protein n=1 Tax=Kwoniella dejecticola CBS 10117 TaxID=1296121 RepID=A0A1A5ZWX8_9TREE|nr:uncharacterized protein I303_07074 [Kwoniella dejecticola CBS 10117]OBR82315.1 hypothetical protein I303_07074 [Kwoniella dejecticola CBS 10117]
MPTKEVLPSLSPLPDEVYPLENEKKKPDQGYYVALGLVMSVWMITPLCCAYLIWFTLFTPALSGASGLTATIFAAYAITEILFSIYLSYLIKYVQTPSPASNLPISERTILFLRVLHSNLAYPVPPRGVVKHEEGDAERSWEIEKAEEDYQKGFISVAQLHHIRNKEYEESVGIQEKKRVGKMDKQEKETIQAFVEDYEGQREEKLKAQVENGVLPNTERKEWGYEGIIDENEQIVKLHPWDKRAIDFRERLRTWFNYAPWDTIKRRNIEIWLAWSCFNCSLEEALADEENKKYLEYCVELLEARTGSEFEDGYDPKIQVMRLTMDPVHAKARPLILYAVTNVINLFLQEVVYPYQGMGLYREGDMEYLIRIPKGWTPEKGKTVSNAIPIVYMHGLGFGLLQSHLLIKHLLHSLPTHPILIPLSPHTSQSLFHHRHLRPCTRAELVRSMKKICTQWGFWDETARSSARGGVSMLSHSNGSVGHGWILKDCPTLIKRNTFVDPVVFCLWEGDVCYNFCYRQPSNALELLLYYFIASEVGIANYISRYFDWADNTLFFDEIPGGADSHRTAFFLGGTDMIIDAARVRRYLERHGVTNGLHWDAQAGHGDGLNGSARDRVIMFAGTGSTSGWETWLKSGRRRHSLGEDDILRHMNGNGHNGHGHSNGKKKD